MSECLYRHAFDGGEIQVWQDGDHRSLWFDEVILQSEIDLNGPATLPNPANQAMLAHLLFGQSPQRVLLAGCGGGAVARWFHARSPDTRGDAVELSAEVAQVAHEWFEFPGADSGWQLHIADIRDFVAGSRQLYDFILVDLEEAQYSPDWVCDEPFLADCWNVLSNTGVLTLNLIPHDAKGYTRALSNIRHRFQRRTLSLPIAGHDNQLVMAFREAPPLQGIEPVIDRAAERWDLPLRRFWQTLRQHNPAGCGIF